MGSLSPVIVLNSDTENLIVIAIACKYAEVLRREEKGIIFPPLLCLHFSYIFLAAGSQTKVRRHPTQLLLIWSR